MEKWELREVRKLTKKANVCCKGQDTGYCGWGVNRKGCKGDFWNAADVLLLSLFSGYQGTLILWKVIKLQLDVICLLLNIYAGKDWRREDKEATEDEMVGWHRQQNEHEFEQTLGDSEEPGGLVCSSPEGGRVGHDWATKQQQICMSLQYKCQKRARKAAAAPTWLQSLTQIMSSRACSFCPRVQTCKPCWPGPAEAPLTLKASTQ